MRTYKCTCIHTFWSTYLPKKISRRTKVKQQATAEVFQSWVHITFSNLKITKAWAPPNAECISLEYKVGFGIFIKASQQIQTYT